MGIIDEGLVIPSFFIAFLFNFFFIIIIIILIFYYYYHYYYFFIIFFFMKCSGKMGGSCSLH